LVRGLSSAVDEKLGRAFADAHQALARLPGPLEIVVGRSPDLLTQALNATKTLELAVKVDMASVLGVTLTFQTGDGD
jgi:hypothetical protein